MYRNLSAYLELYNLSAYENAILEVAEDLDDLREVDDELASRVQFRSEVKRRRWVGAIADAKRHCASGAPSSALLEVKPSYCGCCVAVSTSIALVTRALDLTRRVELSSELP